MIKLFRKIRQQLLTENKTVKYLKYIFGEIVLVGRLYVNQNGGNIDYFTI